MKKEKKREKNIHEREKRVRSSVVDGGAQLPFLVVGNANLQGTTPLCCCTKYAIHTPILEEKYSFLLIYSVHNIYI